MPIISIAAEWLRQNGIGAFLRGLEVYWKSKMESTFACHGLTEARARTEQRPRGNTRFGNGINWICDRPSRGKGRDRKTEEGSPPIPIPPQIRLAPQLHDTLLLRTRATRRPSWNTTKQWKKEQVWQFFGCCTADSQTDTGRNQLYNNGSPVLFSTA